MSACGRLLSPGSSGRAITKLVNSTLVQYAACCLPSFTARWASQFDSDYSVGDQASPPLFSPCKTPFSLFDLSSKDSANGILLACEHADPSRATDD